MRVDVIALGGVLALNTTGCGGIQYTVVVSAAASRVEEARVQGAERLALPYEYYFAREHLEQAQVEAAERCLLRCRELRALRAETTRRRGDRADPKGAARASMRPRSRLRVATRNARRVMVARRGPRSHGADPRKLVDDGSPTPKETGPCGARRGARDPQRSAPSLRRLNWSKGSYPTPRHTSRRPKAQRARGLRTEARRSMVLPRAEPTIVDTDGDGIDDTKDQCVLEPEDVDGYQRTRRLPRSGQRRRRDPRRGRSVQKRDPEDFDGWKDDDGLPDPDNDGDGIPDVEAMPAQHAGEIVPGDKPGCCQKKTLVVVTEKIRSTQQIRFDFNKAIIKPGISYKILEKARWPAFSSRIRKIRLEVQGHGQRRRRHVQHAPVAIARRGRARLSRRARRRRSAASGPRVRLSPAARSELDRMQNRALNRRVQFIRTEGASPSPSPVSRVGARIRAHARRALCALCCAGSEDHDVRRTVLADCARRQAYATGFHRGLHRGRACVRRGPQSRTRRQGVAEKGHRRGQPQRQLRRSGEEVPAIGRHQVRKLISCGAPLQKAALLRDLRGDAAPCPGNVEREPTLLSPFDSMPRSISTPPTRIRCSKASGPT